MLVIKTLMTASIARFVEWLGTIVYAVTKRTNYVLFENSRIYYEVRYE